MPRASYLIGSNAAQGASAFNAGVAAMDQIEERRNQALLEAEKQKANQQAEERRADLQLRNTMAEFVQRKQYEMSEAIRLAHDPLTHRINQINAATTEFNNTADAIWNRNQTLLDNISGGKDSPDNYNADDLSAIKAQQKEIYDKKQALIKNQPDPTQDLTYGPDGNTPSFVPSAPQPIVPRVSAAYLASSKATEDAASETSSLKLTNERLRNQNLQLSNAEKKKRLDQFGGMTNAQLNAHGRTIDSMMGLYNEWNQSVPKVPDANTFVGGLDEAHDPNVNLTDNDRNKVRSWYSKGYLSPGEPVTPAIKNFLGSNLRVQDYSKLGISGDDAIAGKAATKFTVAAPAALNSIDQMLDPVTQQYFHHRLSQHGGATNVTDFNGFMQQIANDTQDKNPYTARAAQSLQQKIGVARGFANQPLPDDDTDTGGAE